MVLIYGEPTVGNGYSTHEISWEQCYSMCYWDANCSLSYHYSSICRLYPYGNYTIKHLNSTDGKLIGMKRNLTTDTCPTEPTGTDSYNDDGVVYKNSITSDGNYFYITYTVTLECDSGTKLFRRDNYWVCVGVKYFSGCGKYVDAVNLCKQDGWESITGPYGTEEMNYFWGLLGSKVKGRQPLLWVDGYKGTFADKTLNNGTSYPKCVGIGTIHCVFFGHTSSNCYKKTSVHDCDIGYDISNCWRGATCLKKVFGF